MMNKKNSFKATMLIVIVLLVSLVVGIISWATSYTGEEATEASKEVAITVENWVDRLVQSAYDIIKEYSHESLGENPTITLDIMRNSPNLYCSAKGVGLNGNATWTREGEWDATPAEAWVLAESDKNLPGTTSDATFTTTEELFLGEDDDLEEFGEIQGTMVYRVKNTGVGEEEYVIKEQDDKYYYVKVDTGSGGGDGTYSYVQYAWWLVCTRNRNSYTPEDLSAGLYQEAKDFEKYVEEMGGKSGDEWLKNEDGTFKIDYNVGIKPDNSSDLKVTFNASTNKYIVGPMKLNYTRRTTQQGNRAKVEFAGISKLTLVGVDANGNEVLDSSGQSVFIQNTNYKIVYADETAHKETAAGFNNDTDETYPYPYDGEEFYLEIDYIEDVVALKSFKVDFKYLTAKGKYETYTGEHVIDDEGNTAEDQYQSNATGPNEIVEVDSFENGLEGSRGCAPVELEIFLTPVPLYTSLGGMVWIDNEEQKDSSSGKLGLYDGKDVPAAKNSVEVVVWKVKYEISESTYKEIEREKAIAWKSFAPNDNEDNTDNQIDFIENRIYVDEKGEYSIPVIQIPSEQGLDTSKYRIAYDVEFVYDGQTYEATEFLVTENEQITAETKKELVEKKLDEFYKTEKETAGTDKDYEAYAKSSYVIENADERKDFDSYFTEVYGDSQIDVSKIQEVGVQKDYNQVATTGKATGGIGASSQYAKEEYGEGAGSTQQVEAKLEYNSQYSIAEENGTMDLAKTKSQVITHDADGYIYDQYKFAARVSESGLTFPYEEKYHVMDTDALRYDNIELLSNTYKPVYEYFHQINLGLLEREEADVSVIKDLYTANVVVNEHLSTYHYNKLGQLTDEALTLQEKLGYRKQKYTIDLYNSDYYYRSSAYASIEDEITKELVTAIKDGTELQLFLTYRIQFTNEADNMNASINEFKDYYDSSFTLVTNEMCKNVSSVEGNTEVSNDDGQLQKYISSITAAGDDTETEVSREARTVAYSPYYRKLTTLSNTAATSTTENSTTDNTDYYWNRDEDLDPSKVKKVELSAKNLDVTVGEDVKTKDGITYHTFTYSGLTPVDSINKEGKLPSSDALVIEPNETIEFYVSFQVDVEGFKKAAEQTETAVSVANEDANKDQDSAQKDESGNIIQAAEDTVREKLTGAKSNVVEITRYSTGYNYQEQADGRIARHRTVSYSNGNVSGRIDQDSAPNNMNISEMAEFKYTEDDNEYAPTVQVSVQTINDSRKLDGTVWEDLREENKTSDGVYNTENESGIGNIDVTMVEKIRVTKQDLRDKGYTDEQIAGLINVDNANDVVIDNEFEYVWKDGQIPGFVAQTKSSAEESNLGYYVFTNFPTGTFVVRFEYGNDADVDTDIKYNGQDYQNTAYQKNMTNPTEIGDNVPTNSSDMTYLAGKSTLNNEWHDLSSNENAKLLEEKRVSDARDYEPQRMRVIAYSRTISNANAEVLASAIGQTKDITGEIAADHVTNEYKDILEENKQELVENTRMVANTAKLFVDVEKQDQVAYKTVATTEGDSTHEYYIKNIDFGLVERAETRINIQKEISKIQLLKNDGAEVILSVECDENGNIIKAGGTEGDTIRVEKVMEIEKANLNGQGFKYIAMESSFLKGLQVKLTYRTTVYNNSETDYIGSTIANIKNAQTIYNLANNFENTDTERLYSDGEYTNTVPFISGKGIIYGRYLGSYYYTGDYEEKDAINTKYSAKLSDEASYDRYDSLSIVTTTIDQLVDYIDNDLSISIDDTSNYENQVWVNSSDSDRENKLSAIAYEPNEAGNYLKTETQLQDDKERAYVVKNGDTTTSNNISFSMNETITDTPIEVKYSKIKMIGETQPETGVGTVSTGTLDTEKSEKEVTDPATIEAMTNGRELTLLKFETDDTILDYIYTTKKGVVGNQQDVYNTSLTLQLAPGESTKINIVTTAQANEEAINNMNYDNLVEIAVYSNTVGRRDMQAIPGNANMIAKDYKAYEAGYKKVYTEENSWIPNEVTYDNGEVVKTERDAYAAVDTVTFSEPTGLNIERQTINKIINIILVGLIIAAVAIIAITMVIVFKKTKVYDDQDILNPGSKH